MPHETPAVIHLTLTPSRLRPLDLEPTDNIIEDVTDLCTSYDVDDEKDGLAIIPARFKECPEGNCAGTPGKTRDRCLLSGGGLHRLNANVTEMTALGCDLDDISDAAFGRVLASLNEQGLMYWAWETFSHVPGSGTTRARVLIPFTKPLPLKHPKQWRDVAWPALIRAVGLDAVAAVDGTCKDAARVYYTPKKPTEDAAHEAGFHPGVALDWYAVLGDALDEVPIASSIPDALEEDPERAVDLEPIRATLRRIKMGSEPGGLAWMVKRILDGKAPVPPPKERDEGMPSRYQAWRTVTSSVANAAEGWESRAVLGELLRDAFADEVQSSPQDHTDWATVEKLLETAMASAPAHKAQREAERKAKQEAQRKVLKRALRNAHGGVDDTPRPTAPSSIATTGASDPAPATVEPLSAAPPDWTDGLIFITQKNGDQRLEGCSANLEHLLRCAPEWKGVFRRNTLTRRIEMHGGPLQAPGVVTPFYDEIVANVADWFQRRPDEFRLKLGDNIVVSRIRAVATANAYDPMQDYLNGLQWDGAARVNTALETYCAASTIGDDSEDCTEYVRVASKRWFISAVARGMVPGCKVDTVLILEGLHQGEKKSTAFQVLGGDWYTAQYIDIHDRNSWALITRQWIVELGELETFRKSEETAKKAFFSQQVDSFRKAYGYEDGDYPRRCIFVGSTNRTDYLKDETGNRRYWPVRCSDINIAALRRDRDQLWAEAVALFKAGGKDRCSACAEDAEDRCSEHRWWMSREEYDRLLHRQTEQRMAQDPFAEKIRARLLEKPADQRPKEVTILEAMELIDCDLNKGQEMRVGAALRRLGFVKVQRRFGAERRMMWVVPESLLGAAREVRSGLAGAVQRASEKLAGVKA